MTTPPSPSVLDGVAHDLDLWLGELAEELVMFRRDLHAHPETGRAEIRTTAKVAHRLTQAGLSPRILPGGTGLLCDIGTEGRLVALRADLDALPIDDEKVAVEYRSTVAGVCHACGHDIHTAIAVGVALVLARLAEQGRLTGRVRMIFQPAEEDTPGGALDVIAAGGLDDVSAIYCLHCDPRQDVGHVGLRTGPITGSSDHVRVVLSSIGGHTARPHLTGDLVYALAKVVTDVPSVLSRRVDPRAGLSVVWGRIASGGAANVIPQHGEAEGTVRSLDAAVWEHAPEAVTEAVTGVAAPYGVRVRVDYTRGVPPVINDAHAVETMTVAARELLGADRVAEVEQSLGGEDFAWYLEKVPGALARLGVRSPGDETARDLHQGTFDADERAIPAGVRLLVGTALLALS